MSGSVVFNLIVLFITGIMLVAASCIFAFVRKRWLLARRTAEAARKSHNVLFDANHAPKI